MKLGIMQPYFFPYLGYFDLINRADKWVVFDTPQYMRHGWVNRNRILHPHAGWQYVIAPLKKHALNTPINQISTAESPAWRSRIPGQLMHYGKRAPNFKETMQLVERSLAPDESNLSRLNVHILGTVCAYLGIPWDFAVLSEMQLKLGEIVDPGEWALRICEALGATEYINPPGGAELFDRERFARSGIKLTIQKKIEFAYACPGYQFVPDLSVIDLLMWNRPARIKDHLNQLKAG